MNERTLSFEFFPPRNEQARIALHATRQQLRQFSPAFFSCTYGAGGSTRDGTLQTVTDIIQDGLNAAPHLACIGANKAELRQVLNSYRDLGVRRIVALRGDMPSGMGLSMQDDDLLHASDLVRFIRQEYGDLFHIEVAAYPEFHPQADSAEQDIQHFVEKCKAGANSAITQYFYNPDAYFYFLDALHAHGVDIPIVPGIMPISGSAKLLRFSNACGAEVPRWLRLKLQSYADDSASLKAFGLDVVTQLCETLLKGGASGLHFYTLNAAGTVSTICQRLGL